jgi:hypothetical protein
MGGHVLSPGQARTRDRRSTRRPPCVTLSESGLSSARTHTHTHTVAHASPPTKTSTAKFNIQGTRGQRHCLARSNSAAGEGWSAVCARVRVGEGEPPPLCLSHCFKKQGRFSLPWASTSTSTLVTQGLWSASQRHGNFHCVWPHLPGIACSILKTHWRDCGYTGESLSTCGYQS